MTYNEMRSKVFDRLQALRALIPATEQQDQALLTPRDYAQLRAATINAELVTTVSGWESALAQCNTELELKQFFTTCCDLREKQVQGTILSFFAAPESDVNRFYWDLAILIFAPKTLDDLLAILLPSLRRSLSTDATAPIGVKPTIENTQLILDEGIELLDDVRHSFDITILKRFIAADGVLLDLGEIQHLPLLLLAQFMEALETQFPTLYRMLSHRSPALDAALLHTLAVRKKGKTIDAALSDFSDGLLLGGVRFRGTELEASKHARDAYEAFYVYLNSLTESVRKRLLALRSDVGEKRSVQDILDRIEKGKDINRCVDIASSDLQKIRNNPANHAFLQQGVNLTDEQTNALAEHYGASPLDVCGEENTTAIPEDLATQLLTHFTFSDANDYYDFLREVSPSQYRVFMSRAKVLCKPAIPPQLAAYFKEGFLNAEQRDEFLKCAFANPQYGTKQEIVNFALAANDPPNDPEFLVKFPALRETLNQMMATATLTEAVRLLGLFPTSERYALATQPIGNSAVNIVHMTSSYAYEWSLNREFLLLLTEEERHKVLTSFAPNNDNLPKFISLLSVLKPADIWDVLDRTVVLVRFALLKQVLNLVPHPLPANVDVNSRVIVESVEDLVAVLEYFPADQLDKVLTANAPPPPNGPELINALQCSNMDIDRRIAFLTWLQNRSRLLMRSFEYWVDHERHFIDQKLALLMVSAGAFRVDHIDELRAKAPEIAAKLSHPSAWQTAQLCYFRLPAELKTQHYLARKLEGLLGQLIYFRQPQDRLALLQAMGFTHESQKTTLLQQLNGHLYYFIESLPIHERHLALRSKNFIHGSLLMSDVRLAEPDHYTFHNVKGLMTLLSKAGCEELLRESVDHEGKKASVVQHFARGGFAIWSKLLAVFPDDVARDLRADQTIKIRITKSQELVRAVTSTPADQIDTLFSHVEITSNAIEQAINSQWPKFNKAKRDAFIKYLFEHPQQFGSAVTTIALAINITPRQNDRPIGETAADYLNDKIPAAFLGNAESLSELLEKNSEIALAYFRLHAPSDRLPLLRARNAQGTSAITRFRVSDAYWRLLDALPSSGQDDLLSALQEKNSEGDTLLLSLYRHHPQEFHRCFSKLSEDEKQRWLTEKVTVFDETKPRHEWLATYGYRHFHWLLKSLNESSLRASMAENVYLQNAGDYTTLFESCADDAAVTAAFANAKTSKPELAREMVDAIRSLLPRDPNADDHRRHGPLPERVSPASLERFFALQPKLNAFFKSLLANPGKYGPARAVYALMFETAGSYPNPCDCNNANRYDVFLTALVGNDRWKKALPVAVIDAIARNDAESLRSRYLPLLNIMRTLAMENFDSKNWQDNKKARRSFINSEGIAILETAAVDRLNVLQHAAKAAANDFLNRLLIDLYETPPSSLLPSIHVAAMHKGDESSPVKLLLARYRVNPRACSDERAIVCRCSNDESLDQLLADDDLLLKAVLSDLQPDRFSILALKRAGIHAAVDPQKVMQLGEQFPKEVLEWLSQDESLAKRYGKFVRADRPLVSNLNAVIENYYNSGFFKPVRDNGLTVGDGRGWFLVSESAVVASYQDLLRQISLNHNPQSPTEDEQSLIRRLAYCYQLVKAQTAQRASHSAGQDDDNDAQSAASPNHSPQQK